MQQKYELGSYKVNLILTQKWENIPKFYFCIRAPSLRCTCPSFLLSKLASEIKLMQSVVGVSCQSQGPRVPLPGSRVTGSHVPGLQVPRPRVVVAGSQVSGCQGPGPQVSGLRVPDPGSQVLILDYALRMCYRKKIQSARRKLNTLKKFGKYIHGSWIHMFITNQ